MAKRTRNSASESRPAESRRAEPPRADVAKAADAPALPRADQRLAWLDRMRPFRTRHERDVGLDGVIQALEREMRDKQNAVGDIVDVWNQIAPPVVRDLAAIGGVAQGTLTLVVTSSGASYELGRHLRDGLERTLMQRLPTRVKRIRVKIAGG